MFGLFTRAKEDCSMTPEQATFLAEQMASLMEQEMPATRKVLAALSTGRRDYRPDDRSRTAWELAVHLATADVWFLDSILKGAFVWDAEALEALQSQFRSADDVVRFYERELPARLQAVRAASGADLTRTVDFFGMFQWPAVKFLGFANNHSVHHRGQLAAYLRAMGSKVPAIYGGSADEPMTPA
jgi:uncharacterized damage-inducible protein DinB